MPLREGLDDDIKMLPVVVLHQPDDGYPKPQRNDEDCGSFEGEGCAICGGGQGFDFRCGRVFAEGGHGRSLELAS